MGSLHASSFVSTSCHTCATALRHPWASAALIAMQCCPRLVRALAPFVLCPARLLQQADGASVPSHPPRPQEGDADTNAAIVGGLLGALHGAATIPEWMKRPVLGYQGREDQGGGRPRSADLRAARLPGLALQLYQLAGS